jgi:SAM-dependent methyltransferase
MIDMPFDPASRAEQSQDALNRAVYTAPKAYRHYRSETLEPPEIACLLKYRPKIAGKAILDIGVGGGRTTRYLAPLAARYEAIDYSPVMVDYMRRKQTEISTNLADFRDLSLFGDCSFDFVFATNNVIDALPHEGRLKALLETHRVLRPTGILAFSSHNLNYHKALAGPHIRWSRNPRRLCASIAKFPLSIWNHVRVGTLREIHSDYALLNDSGHCYACFHYYAKRSTIISQLQSAGLQVRDIFDKRGQSVSETSDDSANSSLTYVAERLC